MVATGPLFAMLVYMIELVLKIKLDNPWTMVDIHNKERAVNMSL